MFRFWRWIQGKKKRPSVVRRTTSQPDLVDDYGYADITFDQRQGPLTTRSTSQPNLLREYNDYSTTYEALPQEFRHRPIPVAEYASVGGRTTLPSIPSTSSPTHEYIHVYANLPDVFPPGAPQFLQEVHDPEHQYEDQRTTTCTVNSMDDNVILNPRTQVMTTSSRAVPSTSGAVDDSSMSATEATRGSTSHYKTQYSRNNWHKNSMQWRSKLGRLLQVREKRPEKLVKGLQQIILCTDKEFKIGRGSYGTVYLGLMTDMQEVAVKQLSTEGTQWEMSMQKEVDLLAQLKHHDNIVSYKLTEWPKGRYGYIITELCEFSLDDWFKTDKVLKLSDEEWNRTVPGLWTDLLSGLNHLHTHNPMIFHRDIKPKNVLVALHKEKARLKLADFGISRTLGDGQTTLFTNIAGTETWQAPEVIEQSEGIFDYKYFTDIHAGGMVCYYIVSRGTSPFHAASTFNVRRNITDNNADLSALDQQPLGRDLIVSMLVLEPKHRPSAATLLRHPYFWHERRRYKFLTSVGSETEIAASHELSHQGNAVRQAIEDTRAEVLPNGNDWVTLRVKLSQGLDAANNSDRKFLGDFNYAGYVRSPCKLLRTMRNFQEHYNQLSSGAQEMLGKTCYPYEFFDSEVPKLFPTVYAIIKTSDWTQREKLKEYFFDTTDVVI